VSCIIIPATDTRSSSESPFPDGFVEETLQTLALLFHSPRRDKRLKNWYRRKLLALDEKPDFSILELRNPPRQIEDYKYWRDRLVELKEAYDSEGPRTPLQWWYDRRDGMQWYAIWVAVFFTVLFGLIQSIEGAIQIYKAFRPSASPSN
jgi:hypothetical protein